MIEARVFVKELDSARAVLDVEKADFKGFYKIHDTIFQNDITKTPLSEEFLRLRYIPENIWDEKAVILAIKKTIVRTTGKVSNIPAKIQIDNLEDAQRYYENNFRDTYSEDYSFWRDGWQYYLPNGDVVDLEIVEDDYPTIEFKSETDDGILALIAKFGISKHQIIDGPSVTAIRKLLKSS